MKAEKNIQRPCRSSNAINQHTEAYSLDFYQSRELPKKLYYL